MRSAYFRQRRMDNGLYLWFAMCLRTNHATNGCYQREFAKVVSIPILPHLHVLANPLKKTDIADRSLPSHAIHDYGRIPSDRLLRLRSCGRYIEAHPLEQPGLMHAIQLPLLPMLVG